MPHEFDSIQAGDIQALETLPACFRDPPALWCCEFIAVYVAETCDFLKGVFHTAYACGRKRNEIRCSGTFPALRVAALTSVSPF